ncbi:MAG: ATP-binding cassette domain-containing protein [Acidimicrobiia bacterium]|nr:ATP-binding cassette domain-containing protein [Acidimicrobiia bacterium]
MKGNDSLVRARGLTKRFGDFTAVDAVDFDIAPGESFGFLGPNGAGKTSTMKMITTVSPITDGDLTVFDLDPVEDGPVIRSRLGVVPQEDNLDLELSVAENLYVYGRYHDLDKATIRLRIDELLDFSQLSEKRDSPVDDLSGGMKRRLTIARSLINQPDLVILDEPTTGLDPQARHVLWDRLRQLKSRGATLIITTHYMDEAQQLCDRLVVMDGGRIVAEDSPAGLIRTHSTREVLELFFDPVDHAAASTRLENGGIGGIQRVETLSERILLYTEDADATLTVLESNDFHPRGTLTRRSTLEDVFLRLTGRHLTD